jgi:hypothetical protein
MFPSRSRILRSKLIASKRCARDSGRPAGPMLEALESRCLLSTYVVTSLADVPSTTPGYTHTLRSAIARANANGATGHNTIVFGPDLAGTIDLTQGTLFLTDGNTTIDYTGKDKLNISGQNITNILQIDQNVTAHISGLSIIDGYALPTGTKGGGIANIGSLTIDHCTFSNDSADIGTGGGIYNSGTLTVFNSTFPGDSAYSGGGIYNQGLCHLNGCSFSDDAAAPGAYGGGIYNASGNLYVTGCSFLHDSAGFDGGGIVNITADATVTNSNFTGDTGADGAGIANEDATLNVSNTSFTNDDVTSVGPTTGYGGGIYNVGGPATVKGCAFRDDKAYELVAFRTGGNGGGIDNADDGTLNVSLSYFTDDTAESGGSGGGIANEMLPQGGGTNSVTVSDSTFSGNNGEDGGGIYNEDTLTVTGTTFSADMASDSGGGIYNTNSLTVTNSTFWGNSAGFLGGGIDNDGAGTLLMTNATVADNSATGGGGGINVFGNDVTLYNTIVIGNTTLGPISADNINGNLDADLASLGLSTYSSFDLVGADGSGGLVNGTNGNIVLISDASADLGTLAFNGGPTQTVAISAGSPARDNGSVALAEAAGLTTDQRGPGFARIVNDMVDIGAYEIQ